MKTLLDEATIQCRVAELGEQIAADYAGQPLTVLGVLTGSLMFVADLVRQIDTPLEIGFLQASSYRDGARSPSRLQINPDFAPVIAGRDVLLVDDILDTGHTLSALIEQLQAQHPRSVKSAVLLWKRERTQVDIKPDYLGFEVPDRFVVGYGLDDNGAWRHLPYLAVVE